LSPRRDEALQAPSRDSSRRPGTATRGSSRSVSTRTWRRCATKRASGTSWAASGART